VSGAFVGRQRQLALAREVLAALVDHQGGVVVATGDGGVGKTRFAREVAALARQQGVDVVWASGWPPGGAPAYWPWPQVVAELDPDAGDALEVTDEEGERERFARFRRAAEAVAKSAAERPRLIVLDDAQSIDADGLLLTRFVAQAATGHGVLLLLTQRTDADVPSHAVELLGDIARTGVTCRFDGLTSDEVGDFIEARGEAADAETVQRVCDLTAGIPFLIEQVLDSGLHHHTGPLPDPVRRLVADRLAALQPTEQSVIEAAAVLGAPLVVSELAAVAGVDETAVTVACRQCVAVGLLRTGERPSDFAFPHELAREAVLASLSADRLADLHGCCVAALGGESRLPERPRRLADHALAQAAHSPAHAGEAVEVVRSAAEALRGMGSPEAAAQLLGAAVELCDRAHLRELAPVLLELGDALVATGRLTSSRDAFRRSAAAAEQAGDLVSQAHAALGLGGIWVQEHRTAETWHAYIGLLQRTIEQLAEDDSADGIRLRAALELRLVAEQATVGNAEPDEVLTAFETLRGVGASRDLLVGLSLLRHVMLGPPHAIERLAVTDELIERARASADDLYVVIGLLWRAADELQLGRPAGRTLVELRARADALGMRAITFVTDAIEVMSMLRAGELEAGEAAAVACHERGVEVGDADAETYFAAHILAIHWYRGTAPALLDVARSMASSSATPVGNPIFTATVAALAAEAGDIDTAEQALQLLDRDHLKQLLPGSTWLVTLFAVVEAAVFLGDTALAEDTYDLLRPYEDMPMLAAIGVCCFGSTARTLGLAARVAGRLDDAVSHLEYAISENQRLGNRPMTAIARADLADTLMLRRRSGDRARAGTLITRAIESGTDLGLTARVERWGVLRDRIERDDTSVGAMASLVRDGDAWLVSASGESARVTATAGVDYLARLLQSVGVDFAAGELAGAELVAAPQELLDDEARRALRDRLGDLESAIDAAVLRGNDERAAALQTELDGIIDHLRRSAGPGGRHRKFDDASERARTSVQKAIRRAIASVGRDCPQLASDLTQSVKTGYRCRYEPTGGAPERWDVRP
jgi:tetratricopeptide (TPR) repeat protein